MSQIPLGFDRLTPEASKQAASRFLAEISRRRSVRHFSPDPIPGGVLETCLAAEEEKRQFYGSRAPDDWLDALTPRGTDADKPFLETAPALVAIFQKNTVTLPDGSRRKTY